MRLEQVGLQNNICDVVGDAVDVGATQTYPVLEIWDAGGANKLFSIDLDATNAVLDGSSGEALLNAPNGYANWAAVTDKDGLDATARTASYGVIKDKDTGPSEVVRLSVGLTSSGADIEMSSLTMQQGIYVNFTTTPKITCPQGSYL